MTRVATGVLGTILALAAAAQGQDQGVGEAHDPAIVRIIPAAGTLAGKAEVETLVVDPDVVRVDFELDGERAASRNRPPFTVHIRFADPPREQALRAIAYGQGGKRLGEDDIIVNRHDPPLRVRIDRLTPLANAVELVASVSVPRGAVLASVEVYLADELVAVLEGPCFETVLQVTDPGPGMAVRVEATLVDGRSVDDAAVIGAAAAEQVAVNLVQVQAVVTSRSGQPLSGLERDDFEITQAGKRQEIDRFYLADDVALSVALLVDTSGSMVPVWQQTLAAARGFLRATLIPRDRALMVTFDERVRLAHALSPDVTASIDSLADVRPGGATALYDSMLFALLQLTGVPGRRALVAVTDGADFGSRSQPEQVARVAQRLGIPIYIVAVGSRGSDATAAMARVGVAAAGPAAVLRLLSASTGGRSLRIPDPGAMDRAFAQINQELRNQYVLTYYTDKLPGNARKAIKVAVRGQKGIRVRTTVPLDP